MIADDMVETGRGEGVTIEFLDESELSLAAEAQLLIDEYAFDPGTDEGRASVSFLRGLFMFTSGLIASDDPDDIEINTVTSGIGIRGTEFTALVEDSGGGERVEVTVSTGSVVVTDRSTGAQHAVLEGQTFVLNTPPPSFETIRFRGEMSQDGSLVLKLLGYTDEPVTIQRSDDMESWNDWQTIEAIDLPVDVEVPGAPAIGREFFRLAGG